MAKETLKETKTVETTDIKVEVAREQVPKKNRKLTGVCLPSNRAGSECKKGFWRKTGGVEAALKAAGKTECTVTEAKGIVEKFMKREVQ